MLTQPAFTSDLSARLDLLLSHYLQAHRSDMHPTLIPPWRGRHRKQVKQTGAASTQTAQRTPDGPVSNPAFIHTLSPSFDPHSLSKESQMNRSIIRMWTLLSILTLLGAAGACSHEIAHSESDQPNWFSSGSTHKEATVYRNSDGSISTEKSTQVTH